MRPSPYIAIEGVIGVGKTTLAQLLQARFQAELVLETFEENPFLASFYADPERYAFQAQVVFLLSRYHQQKKVGALAGRVPLVSDYLFAKDQLFARLNLQGDEWETYKRLHSVMAERIAPPDLVIYLRASVDTLMGRILRRGRPYEQAMPRDYIARLADAYDNFFESYQATPLLSLDTDGLNVVECEADLDLILDQVATRLPMEHATTASGVPLP